MEFGSLRWLRCRLMCEDVSVMFQWLVSSLVGSIVRPTMDESLFVKWIHMYGFSLRT